MVKFKTSKEIVVENSSDDSINENISINIKIKEKIKIGKTIFDEDLLTRAAIVKLSKLKYTVWEITKILNISRKLAWKWANYTNFEGKGHRRSKFNDEEKKFLCEKAIGKITGKDGVSSRNLKKEFYKKFNKKISHSSINNILNEGTTLKSQKCFQFD